MLLPHSRWKCHWASWCWHWPERPCQCRQDETARSADTDPIQSRTDTCEHEQRVRRSSDVRLFVKGEKMRGSSPFLRVDSDGSGFVQPLWDDHIAERAIQPGYLDHIKALVSPVDVSYGGQKKGYIVTDTYFKRLEIIINCIIDHLSWYTFMFRL